jgi:hypothetical protein
MAEGGFWESKRKIRPGSALLQAGLFVLGGALWALHITQSAVQGPPPEQLVAGSATLRSASCKTTRQRLRREPLPGDAARVVVRYDYVVGGRAYESTRYDRWRDGAGTLAQCEVLAQGLRQQAALTVWVDPAWPHFAVLDRRGPDNTMPLFLAGLGSVLALLGGYRLWCSFRSR